MRGTDRFRAAALAVVCVMMFAAAAYAQNDTVEGFKSSSAGFKHGNVGLGVIFGEPTGLSAKFWMTANTGWDIGAAWSWSGDGHFHLHADYLFHNFNLLRVDKGGLPVYLGIGGRVMFRDNADDKFGIRFPIGLEYFFADWPLAIFGEVVPILDLAPSTDGDINGGFGIRFYF